jgi:hypothetical protein
MGHQSTVTGLSRPKLIWKWRVKFIAGPDCAGVQARYSRRFWRDHGQDASDGLGTFSQQDLVAFGDEGQQLLEICGCLE